jgi:hypothetical protein
LRFEAEARIEPGVEHIEVQVEQHEQDGHDQYESLYSGVVRGHQGIDGERADVRPGKHLLDQHVGPE